MKSKWQAFLIVASVFLLAASLSSAQEKSRTVEKGHQYRDPPIEVISKELGNKHFLDDTRVLGTKDWLRDLVLVVKNISDNNIVSFQIDLLVRQNGKIQMGIPVHFRANNTVASEINARTLDGELKTGVIAPGEAVKIKVSDRVMNVFGEELLKRGIEDLEQVTLDFRLVYFDDHTRWVLGKVVPWDDEKQSVLSARPLVERRQPSLAISSCSSPCAFAFAPPASTRFFFHSSRRPLRLFHRGLLHPLAFG